MMKNILMIVPEPFLRPRGTPLSVYGRTRALSKLGYGIDIVTYHIGEEIELENVRVFRTPPFPFVREIPVGPSVPKIFLDLFLLIKTIILLLKYDYDVIHSHEEGAFWGVILAKLFRKEHVYDMHSSLPQQFENFHYANFWIIRTIFRLLEHLVIQNSNAVIYICPELKTVIDTVDRSKATVLIENFGAEEGFSGGGHLDEPGVDRYNGAFKLVYAGTLESYQGIDMLIGSLRHVLDVDFVLIVVGGDDDQITRYREMAKKLGVEKKVEFVGKVSPKHVQAYYQIADALISTRTKGINTPLKIYKYLMSGKPVIATKIWSHTQVLNDEIALLAELSEEDIASKIRRAVTDSNLLERVKEKAREHVRERYTYDEYLRRTREIYERV